MQTILKIVRWIVGLLFIFSGLIKANDPLGLSYKMQEFFEVWHMPAFNDYTLALSLLMIAFEIIAGVALLVGWRMKLVSWLLLILIIFFTFLTGYALFSGRIKTCGCFGDCIPLTAQTSFIKDLALLLLILFLFLNKDKIRPAASSTTSVQILIVTVILSFGFQWYVLKHLPVLDCLPYKKGVNIAEGRKIPANAIPDSTVISFVYEKQGQEVEFTADQFPEDFNDSLYQFVRRYDKVVRKGNAEPPIKDFVLYTLDGTDSTDEILSAPGPACFLFVKDEWNDQSFRSSLAAVYQSARAKQIPFYLVTNNRELATAITIGPEKNRPDKSLLCDGVAIKTAARANPTLYLLKDGTIVGKWGYADFMRAREKGLDEISK